MTEFVVILMDPRIQGNVGAVARAMMNFGVSELRIVGGEPINENARQRAVHAQGILNDVMFFGSFEEAVVDLTLKVATTGVAPDNEKRHLRSHLELSEFSERVMEMDGRIGLIFGRENYGLYNDELKQCDIVMTIPTSDDYPVMNLSHAVSTVLYQLYNDRYLAEEREPVRREAKRENMDRLFHRIDDLLETIDYPEHKRENTGIMIRRILGRAFMSNWEFHTLMGVFSRIERSVGIPDDGDQEECGDNEVNDVNEKEVQVEGR